MEEGNPGLGGGQEGGGHGKKEGVIGGSIGNPGVRGTWGKEIVQKDPIKGGDKEIV